MSARSLQHYQIEHRRCSPLWRRQITPQAECKTLQWRAANGNPMQVRGPFLPEHANDYPRHYIVSSLARKLKERSTIIRYYNTLHASIRLQVSLKYTYVIARRASPSDWYTRNFIGPSRFPSPSLLLSHSPLFSRIPWTSTSHIVNPTRYIYKEIFYTQITVWNERRVNHAWFHAALQNPSRSPRRDAGLGKRAQITLTSKIMLLSDIARARARAHIATRERRGERIVLCPREPGVNFGKRKKYSRARYDNVNANVAAIAFYGIKVHRVSLYRTVCSRD